MQLLDSLGLKGHPAMGAPAHRRWLFGGAAPLSACRSFTSRRHKPTDTAPSKSPRHRRVAVASAAVVEEALTEAPPRRASSKAALAEQESLTLLEWPALCQQLACFTQTTIGTERALTCQLPVGRTQAESERLLQETAEAQRARLTFKGVFDIRRALGAVRVGLVLHPLVLGAIGLTLEAAQRVDSALHEATSSCSALLELSAGMRGGAPAVQEALFQCIKVEDGRILDAASERLATVRTERRQNMQELRKQLDEWARLLHSKGVSERPQVVIRRDRLCIPIRSGRQGELPKGSLALATSASGSTLYMEPEPVVALNNREMALAGEEAEEEGRVLAALSQMVAAHVEEIQGILDGITALDIATARSRHATWLGASRPAFISREEGQAQGMVSIRQAWHPLLLQPCLPPLPQPPAVEIGPPAGPGQEGAETSQQDLPSAGVGLVPELVAEAAAVEPVGSAQGGGRRGGREVQRGGGSEAGSGSQAKHPLPVPTDLRVPPGVRVVAVTGPNTGGKTASLKALGLLSLMAKAGCFIPQAPPGVDGAEGGDGAPRLVWFDKVLADLGDGQSLQQSLSTFSGHVRRIRNILSAVTPASLVLLDEVGSGTDPTEGSALAAALLERLHGSAALTYATTHAFELKELASSTPGFVNASVEFDVATLRPTYRLQWGQAGESNALAVAQGLGFSAAVVAQARQVAAQLNAARDVSRRSQLIQTSLEEQLGEAEEQAQAAAAARRAAEADLAAAQQELQELQREVQALGKAGGEAKAQEEESKAELSRVLSRVRSGTATLADAEEAVRRVEQAAAAANQASMSLVGLRVAEEAGLDWDAGRGSAAQASSSWAGGKQWVPRAGETVAVLKMGGAPGTVTAAPQGQGSGQKVSVRVGALTMEMRLSDLAPLNGGPVRRGLVRRVGEGRGAVGAGREGRAGASQAEVAKAKEKLKAEGVLAVDGEQGRGGSAQGLAVAIQTSRNTVDVRGMLGDDAVSEVERALSQAPPGSVLFLVHGIGTGRVRERVREALKRSRLVQRFEEHAESKGGCTIAYTQP